MNLLKRRKQLMIVSGTLLVAGLIAGHGLGHSAVAAVLLILASIVAGSDIVVRAWNSLRVKHISIELLVTLAATGGIAIGIYEEAAAVTFLFLFGAYLEERTIRRTRKALDDLVNTAPVSALLVEDGSVREVPVHQVPLDAIVRVRPGDSVPVDGTVVSGHSTIDESAITGEPLAAEKTTGSSVFAGAVNRAGIIDVRAERVGAETTLARVIRRVEEAQEAKVPMQRFIERFAQWYTPAMVAVAVGVLIVTRDLVPALTLLVIACPGALVVATPVAIAAGIGRAARGGMLIKGGAFLETVGNVSALVLDKTGTITEGKPRVTQVLGLAGNDREDVLRWAAIAEQGSSHPLAQPIVEAAAAYGVIPTADSGDAIAGQGVSASWNNHNVFVGRSDYLEREGVEIPQEAYDALSSLHENGETAMLVAVDGRIIGVIAVADSLDENVPAFIASLPEAGVQRVIMATGDDARVARVVASQAGITEVHARQLPEDKLALIQQLQKEGYVVGFAGDGINDAPALAAADVGIAMGAGGTDVAIEAADLALMADELEKIPEAITLSRRTMRIIRQNLVIALGTVALLLAGVAGGFITMGSGMLVHEASLLLVVLNSVRLLAPGAKRIRRAAPSQPAPASPQPQPVAVTA